MKRNLIRILAPNLALPIGVNWWMVVRELVRERSNHKFYYSIKSSLKSVNPLGD